MISSEVLEIAWPVLALLAYLFVTAVLSVLTSYHRYALRVHNLVVQSKQQRIDYQRKLMERYEVVEAEPEKIAA